MTEIFLKGYDGINLQGNYFEQSTNIGSYALILHPHPVHGGTMDNKVVFLAYKVFKNLGVNVLRYNSRGVQKSGGEFTNGEFESKDLISVMSWICERAKENSSITQKIYVVGFSFGCYVLLKAFDSIKNMIDKFIMIAPPSNLFDFSAFSKVDTNGLIIQGTCDDIVPVRFTDELLQNSSQNILYKKIDGAGHFFVNHESELSDAIRDFILK